MDETVTYKFMLKSPLDQFSSETVNVKIDFEIFLWSGISNFDCSEELVPETVVTDLTASSITLPKDFYF